MKTSAVTRAPVKMRLALHCGGYFSTTAVPCQRSVEVSLEALSDNEGGPGVWAEQIRGEGWFVTTVTPPGQGFIVFDILCPTCGPKVLPAELVEFYLRDRRSA